MLDEPTTYLDIAYQVEILDLLMELNKKRGTTILMVLHDINLSARYARSHLCNEQGKANCTGQSIRGDFKRVNETNLWSGLSDY